MVYKLYLNKPVKNRRSGGNRCIRLKSKMVSMSLTWYTHSFSKLFKNQLQYRCCYEELLQM